MTEDIVGFFIIEYHVLKTTRSFRSQREVDELWEQLKDTVEIFYPIDNFEHNMREFAIKDNNGYVLQFGRELKDGEKISIGLYEEFGELFLTFSFDKESDKIPFDLIEQY